MSRILPMGPGVLTQGGYSNLIGKHASKKALANAMTSASSVAAKYDSVKTSSSSSLLTQSLIQPTEKNVKALSAALSDKMTALFKKAGIAAKPAVEISVDADTGKLTVESDRADAAKIETLVNGDTAVKQLAQTLNAISSHTYGLSEHIQFQKEYRASTNAEAVVAKYAALFSAQTSHSFSMRYDGSGVQVLADGKSWLGSTNA